MTKDLHAWYVVGCLVILLSTHISGVVKDRDKVPGDGGTYFSPTL